MHELLTRWQPSCHKNIAVELLMPGLGVASMHTVCKCLLAFAMHIPEVPCMPLHPMQEERERAKQDAVEAKQRQKVEQAQEKLRQKTEAEQEKKRAADQASIIKTIKLKIVSGGAGRTLAGAGRPSSGGANGSGLMPPPPPPPPSVVLQMAPSSMFLSSTGPSGQQQRKGPPSGSSGKILLKPKIKIGGSSSSGLKLQRPPGSLPRPVGAPSGRSIVATGPADRASLEKILNKIQCKDLRKIFLSPVTEAVVSAFLLLSHHVLLSYFPKTYGYEHGTLHSDFVS
jgi:hypothetical protein